MARSVNAADCLTVEGEEKWVLSPAETGGLLKVQFPEGKQVPSKIELARWTSDKLEGVQVPGIPDDTILTAPADLTGGKLMLQLSNEARQALGSGSVLTLIDYYRC